MSCWTNLKMTHRIGYRRTSPADPAAAVPAPLDADELFEEHVRGTDHRRPERTKALARVQAGGMLVCESMRHLARTTDELAAIVDALIEKGAGVEFVADEVTLPPGAADEARRWLRMVLAGARFVRETTAERQRLGIDKAKAKTRTYNGAPLKLDWHKLRDLDAKLKAVRAGGPGSVSEIARSFGLSRETVYRYEGSMSDLLESAKLMNRAKNQKAKGKAEKAAKTKRHAIVTRRKAFKASGAGQPKEAASGASGGGGAESHEH